ncbi:hypothetical protein ACROYT_G001385 [Oculina patagonica]
MPPFFYNKDVPERVVSQYMLEYARWCVVRGKAFVLCTAAALVRGTWGDHQESLSDHRLSTDQNLLVIRGADDICLLAHRHTDRQAMTEGLPSTAAVLGLKVSPKKTKHMRMNDRSDAPITLHGKIVEEFNEFTYLGSKMTTDGDSESEALQGRTSICLPQEHLEKQEDHPKD